MSMKIYDGFRFLSSDLLEIHRDLMSFRPVIQDLAAAAEVSFIADRSVDLIDTAAIAGVDPGGPLSKAFMELLDRQSEVKKTGRNDPAVDVSFNISILPFEGRVYGVPYCSRRKFVDTLHEKGWTEPFGFWDNSDPDENVSEDDWDERGRIWSAIIDQDPASRFGGCGFFVEFLTLGAPSVDDVLPALPSYETRLRRQAKNAVMVRHFGRIKAADPNANVWAAFGYPKSEEGQQEVAVEMERLRAILPQEITREMLIG